MRAGTSPAPTSRAAGARRGDPCGRPRWCAAQGRFSPMRSGTSPAPTSRAAGAHRGDPCGRPSWCAAQGRFSPMRSGTSPAPTSRAAGAVGLSILLEGPFWGFLRVCWDPRAGPRGRCDVGAVALAGGVDATGCGPARRGAHPSAPGGGYAPLAAPRAASRTTACASSYGVPSRSIAQATFSSRSATERSARW